MSDTPRFPADPTDYKNLLSFMMHELRRMHEVLDTNATQLSIAVRGDRVDEPRVRQFVPLVLEELYVMHSWLSIADFYLDPAQFAREKLRRISLFRVFDKARIQLSRRAKSQSVRICIDGSGEHAVMAHSLINVLPFIVLDNAIKYAPTSSRIDISLEDVGSREMVRVTSIGPQVEVDERPHLFEAGIRGKWAKQVTNEGNGQGLALLRAICAYHNATVTATSASSSYSVNRVPYSTFDVEIGFPAA